MRAPDLKRGLGQHHLLQPHLCRPMIDFLAPSGRRVLEIGAGGGALTRRLAAAGAEPLLAVEIDLGWAAELRRRRPSSSVVVADALDLDYTRVPEATLVTGNLPYNVATAVVTRVVIAGSVVPRATFLVQREVAERLTADPATGDYGSLTVFVQAYAEATLLGIVPSGAFRPPPRVDGAMVGLELRSPPVPEEETGALFELVRAGFAHRRKTLRNALAQRFGRERSDRLLAAGGLSRQVRAEELGLDEWVSLHRSARASVPSLFGD